MARRKILKQLWREAINAGNDGHWIEIQIAIAAEFPESAFSDACVALQRMMETGVKREDVIALARWLSYEAVFSTLTTLEEHVESDALDGLHEELLLADPSGREGRPKRSTKKLTNKR